MSGGWGTAAAVALACGLVAIVLYLPARHGGFVWDDGVLIVRNDASLDEWSDAARAFSRPVVDSKDVGYYRPLLIASYVADRNLWGKNPGPFHRTNVALHALNVSLVCLVIFAAIGSLPGAAAGALLFAVHPIQCQAVALLLGRNDLLLVPPIAVMLLADRWRAQRADRAEWPAWTAIAGAYALTLWTKETGIVAPLFLLADDLVVRRRRLAELRSRVPLLLVLALVAAAYFAARWAIFGGAIGGERQYGALSWAARLRLLPVTLGYYVQHVLLPWGFAPTPYHPALADADTLGFWTAAGFSAAFLVAVAAALRRQPAIAYGLVFFAIAVSPVLGFARMKLFILEHRLYLPMVGIGFAAGAAVAPLARGPAAGARLGVVAAALAALAVLTTARIPVYRDGLSLWASAVEQVPRSAYAREEYGFNLAEAGRDADAVEQLREAVRLDPGNASARYKLALALERSGRREAAITELARLVKERPRDVDARNALGVFEKRRGNLPRAREVFGDGLALVPDDRAMLSNLANVLDAQGDWTGAAGVLERLVRLEPSSAAAWDRLGRMLYNTRRYGEAAEAFARAVTLDPADATAREHLARARARASTTSGSGTVSGR